MRYTSVLQSRVSFQKNTGEIILESPNQKIIWTSQKMKLCDRKCKIPEAEAKFQSLAWTGGDVVLRQRKVPKPLMKIGESK